MRCQVIHQTVVIHQIGPGSRGEGSRARGYFPLLFVESLNQRAFTALLQCHCRRLMVALAACWVSWPLSTSTYRFPFVIYVDHFGVGISISSEDHLFTQTW